MDVKDTCNFNCRKRARAFLFKSDTCRNICFAETKIWWNIWWCLYTVNHLQVLFSVLLLLRHSFFTTFHFVQGIIWLFKVWSCIQPCSVFSSQSFLSLAISSLMAGRAECQGKRIQRKRGNLKQEFKAENKDQSVL